MPTRSSRSQSSVSAERLARVRPPPCRRRSARDGDLGGDAGRHPARDRRARAARRRGAPDCARRRGRRLPLIALRGPALPRRRAPATLLAISAVTGFVLFPVVYTIGQERTSAMHGSMILAALPVFTGLYAALVTRRRPGPWWLVGCAFALAGEAVIVALRGGAKGRAPLSSATCSCSPRRSRSPRLRRRRDAPLARLLERGDDDWGVLLGAGALVPLAIVLLVRDGLPEAERPPGARSSSSRS